MWTCLMCVIIRLNRQSPLVKLKTFSWQYQKCLSVSFNVVHITLWSFWNCIVYFSFCVQFSLCNLQCCYCTVILIWPFTYVNKHWNLYNMTSIIACIYAWIHSVMVITRKEAVMHQTMSCLKNNCMGIHREHSLSLYIYILYNFYNLTNAN